MNHRRAAIRTALFILLLLATAPCGLADGFIRLQTFNGVGNSPVILPDGTAPGPTFRAALYLVEPDGSLVSLEPQASFTPTNENGGFFVVPVTVRVPGQNPGDQVTVQFKVFDGEEEFGSANATVTLGTQTNPAALPQLSLGTAFAWQYQHSALAPQFADHFFNPSITRDGETTNLDFTFLLVDHAERIVAGGNFNTVNGTAKSQLVRLLPDGTIDPSFSPGLPAGSFFTRGALDSNNRLLLAGEFPFGTPYRRLVRLTENGGIDSSFSADIADPITALLPEQSGKLLVATLRDRDPVIARASLVRLNSDGSLDSTFNRADFLYPTRSPVIRVLGKGDGTNYWVGGNFSLVNSENVNGFARLDTNGAPVIDPDYPSVSGSVLAIWDGLIGGENLAVNGTTARGLVRVSSTNVLFDQFALGINTPGPIIDPVTGIEGEGRILFMNASTNAHLIINGSRGWSQIPIHADGLITHADFQGPNVVIAGAFSHVTGASEPHLGIARLLTRQISLTNLLRLPVVYDDYLLLRPDYAYGARVQYSSDLKTWTDNPSGIRDTNLTAHARFYRMAPALLP